MKKRTFILVISVVLALAALTLIGCGDDVVEPTTFGVIANFEKTQGSVVITDSTGAEKRMFEPGETASVKVTPNEGFIIKSFKMNNVDVELSESGTYTFTVNDTTTFRVVFERPKSETPNTPSGPTVKKCPITLQYDRDQGTVEISDASGNHKTVFDENETVKITVTPKEDYSVSTATVGTEELSLVNGVLTFVAKSSTTVKVNFVIKTYSVTAQFDSALGSVTVCDKDGEEKEIFDKRETVTVTVIPEENYGVYSLLVGSEKKTLDANGKLTFTALADAVIKVEFRKIYSVTAQFDSALGTVKVLNEDGKETGTFFDGQNARITFTPKEGNKTLAVTLNDFTMRPAKTGAYSVEVDEDIVFTVDFIPLTSPLTTALSSAANAESYTVEISGDDINCSIYYTENAAYYYFDDYEYGYGYINGDGMAREFYYSGGDDFIELFSDGDCSTEITAYYTQEIDIAALRTAFGNIDPTMFLSKDGVYTAVFADDIESIYGILTDSEAAYYVECPDGISIELRDGKLYKVTYAYCEDVTTYSEEDEGDEEGGNEEEQPVKNIRYITFTYSDFGTTELPEEIDLDGASTPLDEFVGEDGTALYMRHEDMLQLNTKLGVAVNGVYCDVVFDEDMGFDGYYTIEYLGDTYGLEADDENLALVQGGMFVAKVYVFTPFGTDSDITIEMHGTWTATTHDDQVATLVIAGKSVTVDGSGKETVTPQSVILNGETLVIEVVSEKNITCHDSEGNMYDITLTGDELFVKMIHPGTLLPTDLLTFGKVEED